MNLDLTGKTVLITGGSKGIGLACARVFIAEGARVAIVSRSSDNLTRAKRELDMISSDGGSERTRPTTKSDGGTCQTFPADLTDEVSALRVVEAVERKLGPIDVLVNSAGAARRTTPEDLTPAVWRAAMDAKFFPYINVIDPVIKRMASRQHGVIVNVIGQGGKVATAIHIPGGAANSALMLATAGLAHAYAKQGVRVLAINPGLTNTDRVAEGLQADAKLRGISEDEARKRAVGRIAMGRMADPEEIANLVVFAASPRASYLTGVMITMDGASSPIVI